MLRMPSKAGEIRQFVNKRNKMLEKYFSQVDSGSPNKLRFKSKFLLSHPIEFQECEKYAITMVQGQTDAKSDVSGDENDVMANLKEFIDALPMYQYVRKKLRYPQSRPF